MERILGIDTGTNSLGWAVVERDTEGTRLLDKGVVVFEEGVKIEKGQESSKAAERTGYRSPRKKNFRRRWRKVEVLKVLVEHELCPALTDEALRKWKCQKVYPRQQDFMQWQATEEQGEKNPYRYRHRCLHEQLDLNDPADRFVLGRAMYHLAQRRGFLSNRLDSTPEKETGAVKEGISELSAEMAAAGHEFLGDYFYWLYQQKGNQVRLRCRYTHREQHYRKEFEAICDRQALPESLRKALARALYFQRPLRSQRGTVGHCPYERDKARCALSHPAYEEFRMLQFINNIKVIAPEFEGDEQLRALNEWERSKAIERFLLKTHAKKSTVDFEDIAKAIAGKGNYQHLKDEGERHYRFNYRMQQGFAPCKTTIALRRIFGEDYQHGIAECYAKHARKDATPKTPDEMVNDVWNVLSSFADESHLEEWARTQLQLSDEAAAQFAQIHLSTGFASLSLKAIRKMLPFLRKGYVYALAAFLANVPTIVGRKVWEESGEEIERQIRAMYEEKEAELPLEKRIRDFLRAYVAKESMLNKLYHPSQMETYPDARPNKDGLCLLGSPRTNAIRNPMAMRSLHQVRQLINTLLKRGLIDAHTTVHIEYARELNDANKRAAIGSYQKEQEKLRQTAREAIKEHLNGAEPTAMDITKYLLWEEQEHICLYTGRQIALSDFLGEQPNVDIEHTIPRSQGGDSTMENMTLCDGHFNRYIKRNQLPTEIVELGFHYDALAERLKPWQKKVDHLRQLLDKQRTFAGMSKEQKDKIIQKRHRFKQELNYWEGKLLRFAMKKVPQGFSLRQGAGIGLISKYTGFYLRSLFKKKGEHGKDIGNVKVVKGPLTAEFRRLWGLQTESEKKSRENHVHHCLDAIVIACIGTAESQAMARYYRQEEEARWGQNSKPHFPKPWSSFTEDLKAIQQELLVVHHSTQHLRKKARRKVVKRDGQKMVVSSHSARGCLHNDTHYGAIQQEGTLRYVQRKPLSKDLNVKSIVDDTVREKIEAAIRQHGSLEKAIAQGIYMNEKKGILIKKVRCYIPTSMGTPTPLRTHRDASRHDYKQQVYVATSNNYMLALYEGVVGKRVRSIPVSVSLLEAAQYFNRTGSYKGLVPAQHEGLALKWTLTKDTMVLLLEEGEESIDFQNLHSLSKRLFKVVGIGIKNVTTGGKIYPYGNITLRHHQEARPSGELSFSNGAFVMEQWRSTYMLYHSQFRALIEGRDFRISTDGKIQAL